MSLEIQIGVACILFVIGLIGLLTRKNILFILMSLEIMINSAGMVFVMAGQHFHQADGQVMFIFMLCIAATEVSIGLALIIQMFKHFKSVKTDELNKLNG